MLRSKCKHANLRITHQRAIIYEAVRGDTSHPCADDVYQKVRKLIPNISFDTVNRTLLSFVRIGIVKLAESYSRQKRFDPDVSNHHHLHCIKCGKIMDFQNTNLDALKVPRAIENQYLVLGKRVILEYICDKCASKKKGGGNG